MKGIHKRSNRKEKMCGCFAYWNAVWKWRRSNYSNKLMIDDPYDMHCYYNPIQMQKKKVQIAFL